MPLNTWSERDELLSDALHMRDVGLGLDRPLVEEILDSDDEYGVYVAALRSTSAGHLDVADELWRERSKPVLTADDKDHPVDAEQRRPQRWADGKAAAEYVLLSRAHRKATLEAMIDEILALDWDAADWEHDVAYGDAGPLFDALNDLQREEEEHLPLSHWSEEQITAEHLAGYVQTMLYTGRGSCSLTVKATGHPVYSTRKCAERLLPLLRARGERDRAIRANARLKVQPGSFAARPLEPVADVNVRRLAARELIALKHPLVTVGYDRRYEDDLSPRATRGWEPTFDSSTTMRLLAIGRRFAVRSGTITAFTAPRRRGRVASSWTPDSPPVAPTKLKLERSADGTRWDFVHGRMLRGRLVRVTRS